MNKTILLAITVCVIILFGGAFLITKDNNKPLPTPEPNTYQYFWGNGCPHCEVVAKFMETWEGKDKIKISKLEVWNNQANARIMSENAKICGIKQSELAVPFMITPDNKCLMGDTPIIEHFKKLDL